MRMNFSHAFYDEAKGRLDRLRNSPGSHTSGNYLEMDGTLHKVINTRAALLDTKGPEIRTGSFKDGPLKLFTGDKLTLTTQDMFKEMSVGDFDEDDKRIFIDYKSIMKTVNVNDTILLNDGAIGLKVVDLSDECICKVLNDGELGNKKGVNIPGKELDLPALTDKDKQDLSWGIENDVDYIAQSFVRKGSDVVECKQFMRSLVDKIKAENPSSHVAKPSYYLPKVIAKIESAEALENFDDILDKADGIMVARGDLGVEIPFRKVTLAQKIMIRKCNEAGKPVIVATQMLESMQSSPRPTRAEVSDVTNAVYDGCDAVMLSGESANGKYPIESVKVMTRIIRESDAYMSYFEQENIESTAAFKPTVQLSNSRQEALCKAAVEAADSAQAKLIIVLVRGGTAARLLAKFRPRQPVMAFCLHPKTARQLSLHRGVFPVVGRGEIVHSWEATLSPYRNFAHRHKDPKEAIAIAKEIGWVSVGDTVVVVSAEQGDVNYGSSLGVNIVQIQ